MQWLWRLRDFLQYCVFCEWMSRTQCHDEHSSRKKKILTGSHQLLLTTSALWVGCYSCNSILQRMKLSEKRERGEKDADWLKSEPDFKPHCDWLRGMASPFNRVTPVHWHWSVSVSVCMCWCGLESYIYKTMPVTPAANINQIHKKPIALSEKKMFNIKQQIIWACIF